MTGTIRDSSQTGILGHRDASTAARSIDGERGAGRLSIGTGLRVGVVGAGLIGARRARVAAGAGCEVVVVADIDEGRAKALAAEFGAPSTTDWRCVIETSGLDAVVVATVHDSLAPVTTAALDAGLHVLVEKPVGRTPAEVETAVEAAARNQRILAAGYNHRLHAGIRRAHEIVSSGEIGDVLVLRGRYGHGGRPGYEREWRADPVLAGGGELLDQGMHLLDLFSWFAGDFNAVQAMLTTSFWPMPVEDNAFAILANDSGVVALLHTSWTQWKNLFSFEVIGRDGYVTVEGLGGSYGVERLTAGRRRPEGGVPEAMEEREFPGDDSWEAEWAAFAGAISGRGSPSVGGADALRTSRLAARIYDVAVRFRRS